MGTFADIPDFLIRQDRWLLWRIEQRVNRKSGEVTKTKVPIAYATSKPCNVTDPRSWTEFGKVKTALSKSRAWDGPGFALARSSSSTRSSLVWISIAA
jgi:primase-polymerase (primpol)-like protein